MHEYEKMIAGQLYDARDPVLVTMRNKAREFLSEINRSAQDIRDGKRLDLCKALFRSVGTGLWLQPPFYCDYGSNIILGNNVFVNFNCVFLDVALITIGNGVQMGPQVQLYTAAHPLAWDKRRAGQEYGKPITIGDDVWIGGSAVICPGVTVGEKSVIGAGAVVTKDVPAGVVVAGNPAKMIKQL